MNQCRAADRPTHIERRFYVRDQSREPMMGTARRAGDRLSFSNSRLFPAHIRVSPVLGHPLQRDRSKRLVRGRAQLGKTKEVRRQARGRCHDYSRLHRIQRSVRPDDVGRGRLFSMMMRLAGPNATTPTASCSGSLAEYSLRSASPRRVMI